MTAESSVCDLAPPSTEVVPPSCGLHLTASSPPFVELQIQYQSVRLAAGAADHHGVVRCLLGRREYGVAMFRHAGNHPRLAGATNALLAGVGHVHTAVAQDLEDALARWNNELPAGALELHHVAAL